MSRNEEELFSQRDPLPGVTELLHERWSPRAFARAEIEPDRLARVLDAARWAPSCYNAQPWRFYLSSNHTFDDYLALLVDANQAWAHSASVIGFLVGEKLFSHNGEPNPTWRFDCGAAWQSMNVQARVEGLYTHGMAGLHYDKAAEYLQLDSETQGLVMGFAIGYIGEPESLPDKYQDKEVPSPRLSLQEIWPNKPQ